MDRDLAPFFGDLNKSEKTEIRQLLASSRKQLILFLFCSSSSSNGTKPPSGDTLLATPLNNRLHQNGSPNTLLNSESKPFLWTTNESPGK